MGYKIVETKLALKDLDEILSYIAVDLHNITAAAAFADEVEKCYGYLEHTPLMYEMCRDMRLRAMGYRKAVIQQYVMIYKVSEEAKTVSIVRFFYGRMNYAELL